MEGGVDAASAASAAEIEADRAGSAGSAHRGMMDLPAELVAFCDITLQDPAEEEVAEGPAASSAPSAAPGGAIQRGRAKATQASPSGPPILPPPVAGMTTNWRPPAS